MKNITDIEVIESVLKGNQNDFALLIDRYKNKAFSMLKRMLRNDSDAEEVLQDCFMKAYKALNNFKGDARFSTWFYSIVYNTALTKLSSKKRKIESDMTSIDEHFDIADSSINISKQFSDSTELLNKMIEKLPPSYSTVINLFYMEEMSCEEISKVMSTSVANVKVMLHRSRSALKDIIIKKNLIPELL
ncbi:MAG TPA: sigma-70 family RNA polymerase sigma factor [Ignavibacteriaceae bacterium]|nr:sigma-70 family RNA polymerase sigma factor [Ignavibacteriaceae bacterium]